VAALFGFAVEDVVEAFLAHAVRAGQHQGVGVELQAHRASQLFLHALIVEFYSCNATIQDFISVCTFSVTVNAKGERASLARPL
jgi:hypothetical protein